MRLKHNTEMVKIYFYLIPFLHPRGLESFPFLKTFFTGWLYISLFLILLRILTRIRNKRTIDRYTLLVLIYYATMFLVTLLVRGEFTDALQKIFAAPVLCMLAADYLRSKPREFITATNNILIIIFLLAVTVFSPLLWRHIYDPINLHYTFLGHVQISAQLGIVSLFLAYVENYYWKRDKSKRFIIQVLLSLLIIATSFTSASYISLLLLVIFWLLDRTRLRRIFEQTGKVYITIYFAVNILMFWFVLNVRQSVQIGSFTLNGRGFIWKEALSTFFDSPIYGYGVHGIMIRTFWSSWTGAGEGMNYMHNQVLQVLNDGGIILLIPYALMLYYMVSNVIRVSGRMKFWALSNIILILIVMLFESTMNYYYIFLLLSVETFLPQIERRVVSDVNSTIFTSRMTEISR